VGVCVTAHRGRRSSSLNEVSGRERLFAVSSGGKCSSSPNLHLLPVSLSLALTPSRGEYGS
jgi:hypothetical protein